MTMHFTNKIGILKSRIMLNAISRQNCGTRDVDHREITNSEQTYTFLGETAVIRRPDLRALSPLESVFNTTLQSQSTLGFSF